MTEGAGGAPRLELCGVGKSFPGVQALEGVDFDLRAGEVHALVGGNGAGKSTLIKIIAGALRPDAGDYRLDGVPAGVRNPRDAAVAGIRVVYQELELAPDLSVAENVYFGRLPRRGWRVDWKRLDADTAAWLRQVGLDVPPRTRVRRLGLAARQLVEVARALSGEARILVLDEPTSALSRAEIERLFGLLSRLRAAGVATLFVSHKLDEVRAVADRITVLRDGRRVSTDAAADLDEAEIVRRMVGRPLGAEAPAWRTPGGVALAVEGLTTGRVRDVSLAVRAGEVVGLWGLMGAGRTELLRGVLGADRRRAGTVRVRGQALRPNATWRARAAGLGMVPEDRRLQGIFPHLSVLANATMASLSQFAHPSRLWLKRRAEGEAGRVAIERMGVRTPSLRQPVALLSGGNQQKVLLARWLLRADLAVLLVDEPTRGIDVGARLEIYRLLEGLAADGLGILVVSSEMEELLRLCDRIYAMRDGRITAAFERQEVTREALLSAAL